MSIDLSELDDQHDKRNDFRRANGAPLVKLPDGSSTRYSRPSGYAKCLDDESALTYWRMDRVAMGVAKSKALQTKWLAVKDDDKESKKLLREEALQTGAANEAADTGTGLHAMTTRAEDPKDDFEFPEMYEADLKAYMAMLDEYGLVSEHVEVHMINDAYRAAGTADRIYRTTKPLVTPTGEIIPVGTLILGDIKTGKKLDFSLPGYSVQMAIYATGEFYDVIEEVRLPTPEINVDWTLLVHLPVEKGHCELLWCSIPDGIRGASLAEGVKKWRNAWKRGDYDAVEVPKPFDAAATISKEFPGTTVELDGNPTLIEQMRIWVGKRVKQIGEHEKARRSLLLQWPKDLPKPTELGKPGEIVRVLDILDAVEKEHSLPFVGTDPRLAYQSGHKTSTDRSNEFMLTKEAKETKE